MDCDVFNSSMSEISQVENAEFVWAKCHTVSTVLNYQFTLRYCITKGKTLLLIHTTQPTQHSQCGIIKACIDIS